MVVVHWSDVSLELPPEELPQVPVVLEVLHVSLLQLAGEEPDVETQQRPPQEHRQLDVVDATPEAGQGFQGHAAVQADLHVEILLASLDAAPAAAVVAGPG